MDPCIAAVKRAAFSIMLSEDRDTTPLYRGTGFFVSESGWFVTAAHVVKTDEGKYSDMSTAVLTGEADTMNPAGMICRFVDLVSLDERTDLALLRVDLEKNRARGHLKGLSAFPFVPISVGKLDAGDPVFCYSYLLPPSQIRKKHPRPYLVGYAALTPRLTSGIVASTVRGPAGDAGSSYGDVEAVRVYVIDRPLYYGSAGSPVFSAETGNVHAYCSRFEPMYVAQTRGKGDTEAAEYAVIPSLYSTVPRFDDPKTVGTLKEYGIPFATG